MITQRACFKVFSHGILKDLCGRIFSLSILFAPQGSAVAAKKFIPTLPSPKATPSLLK
ncbi:hypothetical protein imdm_2058 [gamma proteobacterium IMCC2047]|nr:hypothetical protein imdm_2058 [gamma proteobacterium IMCC2047]